MNTSDPTSEEVGKIKINGNSCVWIIEDFQELNQENGKHIISPNFWTKTHLHLLWHLELWPKGRTPQNKNKLSLFVNYKWNGISDVLANCDLALLKSNDEKYNLRQSDEPFINCWGYDNFISRDCLLNKNTLKIYCEIYYISCLMPAREINPIVRDGCCLWTIKNFQQLPQKNGDYIFSSNFYVGTNTDLEWYLKLYPKGRLKQANNKLTISLNIVDKGYCVSAKSKFSLFKLNADKYNLTNDSEAFIYGKDSNCFNYDNFISRDDLNDIDTLRICCEITEIEKITPNKQIPAYSSIDVIENSLESIQLTDDVNMQTCSSMDLIGNSVKSIDNQQNSVNSQSCVLFDDLQNSFQQAGHKTIMQIPNNVIQNSLKTNEFAETSSSNMQIPLTCSLIDETDANLTEQKVLEELIEFTCTDKIKNITEMSSGLLAVLNLNNERLKAMSAHALSNNISIANAAETLKLAHIYGDEMLKTQVIAFIKQHKYNVKETQGWQEIVESHPQLLNDIFINDVE